MEMSKIKIYQTDSIKELSAALAKAQASMRHAEKVVNNTFFKSKYADLTACMDAARPFLTANGLSVVQITDFDETGTFLITQLCHLSGEWMRSWYPIKPVKSDPQGLGSAITYGRRYTYCCMTGVAPVDEDDDGNAASGLKQTAKAAQDDFKKILKEIEGSDDPALTWHDNLLKINKILEDDKTFYDQLVEAGAKRKKELEQMESINAGMPEGFKNVK